MRAGRTVVAATLIVAGALYLIGEVTDLDAGAVIADWWPVVLIALGVAQFAVDRTSLYGSLILVGIGLLLLVSTAGAVGGSIWGFVLPLLLVIAGVALLMPGRIGSATTDADEIAAFSVFGTRTVTSTSTHLTGGEATVIAGGLVVDLSDAIVETGLTIRVLAILGGCQILVPPGWEIRLSGVPLLGGWDDTTRRDGLTDTSPRVFVRCVAALAGVEVRHAERWL